MPTDVVSTPRRRATAWLLSQAIAIALVLAACGDAPSGPSAIPAVYQMEWFDQQRVPEDVALTGGVVLHVVSGALTLRADSTYELRVTATRDSGGVSEVLPNVVAAGRYHALREYGDPDNPYSLTFEGSGTDGGAVGLLGSDGFLTAGPFLVGGFPATPSFQR